MSVQNHFIFVIAARTYWLVFAPNGLLTPAISWTIGQRFQWYDVELFTPMIISPFNDVAKERVLARLFAWTVTFSCSLSNKSVDKTSYNHYLILHAVRRCKETKGRLYMYIRMVDVSKEWSMLDFILI